MTRTFSLSFFSSVVCLCNVASASQNGHPPFRRTVPLANTSETSTTLSASASSLSALLPHSILAVPSITDQTSSTTASSLTSLMPGAALGTGVSFSNTWSNPSTGVSSQTNTVPDLNTASANSSDTSTQSSSTATSTTIVESGPIITAPPNYDLEGLESLPPDVSSYIAAHSLYSIDWSNVIGFDTSLIFNPSSPTSYFNSSTRCSTFWVFPEASGADPDASTETIFVQVTVEAPPPTFCLTSTFTPHFTTTSPPPPPSPPPHDSFALIGFNSTNGTIVNSDLTAAPTHKVTLTSYVVPAEFTTAADGPPIQKSSANGGDQASVNFPGSQGGSPTAPVQQTSGQDKPGSVDSGTKDTGNTGNTGNNGGSGDTSSTGNSKVAGNTGNSGNAGNSGNSGNSGNAGNSGNTGNSGSSEFNGAVAAAIGKLFPGSAPSGGNSGSPPGSSSSGSKGGSSGNSGSSSGSGSSGGSSGSNSGGASAGLGAFIASIFGGSSGSNSGSGASGGGTDNTGSPPEQGQVNGVSYSVASNAIVVNGVTYSPIVPQTIVLPNGQSAAIGPQGLTIGSTFIPISSSGASGSGSSGSFGGPPAQGTVNGVSYSVGPTAIVLGGQTFSPSLPTVVALPGGHTANIGPNGFSVDNSFVPINTGGSIAPSQGVINGVPYSFTPAGIIVAGTTYSTSQPTSVTLPNGQTLVIGSDGSVQIGGANVPSPFIGSSTSGAVNGVSYTISPSGITISGTTYPLSTPTSVALPNGQTLVIGADGSAQLGGTPILIPSSSGTSTSGTINGVEYTINPGGTIVVGGQTLSPASPTSITLPGGHTVTIGPNGIIIDGKPVSIPPGFAFAATTVAPLTPVTVNGLALSIGGNIIVVDGTTFTVPPGSTGTTIVVNGETISIGPNGIEITGSAGPSTGTLLTSTSSVASSTTTTASSTSSTTSTSTTTSTTMTSPTATKKPKKNSAVRERDIIYLGTLLVVGLSSILIVLL